MKKMMRAIALFAALMMLFASCAAAAGNVTIAVRGENGFDDYVGGMFVWDDQLVMSAGEKIYAWAPDDKTLTEVAGYKDLHKVIFEGAQIDEEDGTRLLTIGEDELELDANQDLYFSGDMFAAGDTLLRFCSINGPDGDETALLVKMTIGEGGVMQVTGYIELSDEMILDYGDGYTYMRGSITPCHVDGTVYSLSYGVDGREMIAIDLEDGEVDVLSLDSEGEVLGLSPFTEGKLLMVVLDTNADPMVTSLLAYDVESEEIENLGVLPNENWNMPCAIAYDEARGMVYYTLSGSVWRMSVTEAGLGAPQEFGDMPLDVYSDAVAVLLDNYYILSSFDGVVGRDVEAEKLPEKRLRVQNLSYSGAIKRAYFDFTDEHPEYMVSIGDNGEPDAILQDMMNRSSDVDIYTLDVESSQYAALYDRGFMAELDSSEIITGEVNAMYESVRSVVSKNGEVYALPLTMHSDTISMNTELLTGKLGYEESDIPKDWPALFALLNDIAASGKLEEFPEVSVLMPGYGQRDAKYTFFYPMISSYFLWLEQSEENLMRGSEVLLAACEAFEAVDWEALGIPEEFDFDTFNGWNFKQEDILMDNTSISPQYYYNDTQDPLILAMAEGEPQMIGFSITAAFVNPFSQNRDAAVDYLEAAHALMDPGMRVSMLPDENEPVENPYFEEGVKDYDETIADLEKKLADELLTDEEMRETLIQNIENLKIFREEYITTSKWEISPEGIERYRTYAKYGVASRASIWESGTFTQVYQYLDGAITAQQLCRELEKLMQMQRLEGM